MDRVIHSSNVIRGSSFGISRRNHSSVMILERIDKLNGQMLIIYVNMKGVLNLLLMSLS